MRPLLTTLVFAVLLFQRQCASPEQIRASFQSALHPYFPSAVVLLSPEMQTVMALTCVTGAGHQLVKYAADELVKQTVDDGFKSYALTHSGYRFVELAFDTESVRIDLQAKTISYASATPQYAAAYHQGCGF